MRMKIERKNKNKNKSEKKIDKKLLNYFYILLQTDSIY